MSLKMNSRVPKGKAQRKTALSRSARRAPTIRGVGAGEAVGSLHKKETTRGVREVSAWEAGLVYRPQKRLRRVQEDFEQWRNSV